MKKSGKKVRVGVETVRQRGGDSLDHVKQRVRVTREDSAPVTVEYHDTQEEQRILMRDRQQVAAVRGKEAERKVEKEQWLEEKLAKEQIERKESVRLMEMLRSARVISQPNRVQLDIKDTSVGSFLPCSIQVPSSASSSCQSPVRSYGAISPAQDIVDHDFSKRKQASLITSQPLIHKEVNSKPKPKSILKSRPTNTNVPPEKINELKSLINSVKPLDDTEDVSSLSGLSTIQELTENVTTSESRVNTTRDTRVNLNLTRDEHLNFNREVSPFPESEINTERSNIPQPSLDLPALRKLIDRVKLQGEKLQVTESHYLNVSGAGSSKNNKDVNDVTDRKKYQVNQQFIQQVLDFSSASSAIMSSDESSSFRPVQLPLHKPENVAPKKVPSLKTKSSSPQFFQNSVLSPIPKSSFDIDKKNSNLSISNTSSFKAFLQQKKATQLEKENMGIGEEELRQYIVKLLQMKHEEIADLSVTTTSDSSSSRKVDESREILRKYKLTRQSLMHKLSENSSSSQISSGSISSSLK